MCTWVLNWPEATRKATEKNAEFLKVHTSWPISFFLFLCFFLKDLCLVTIVTTVHVSVVHRVLHSILEYNLLLICCVVCGWEINIASKKKDSGWQGCSRREEDRNLSRQSHQHTLILVACASICTQALWTVILPLIASVFYHYALLSSTRSLGSCQRGFLSASHRVSEKTLASAS